MARTIAAFIIYGLLAAAFYGRSPGWTTHLLADSGGDPWSSVWFLNWWPWAILHGQNVLHSAYIYAPIGYDLTWATPVPTAALIAVPLTLTLGALVSFNVLSVLAPALGAFSGFLLLRKGLRASWKVSLLCGLIYGYSSFENGQLRGHLNLDLNFPIPLACLLIVMRVQGRIGRAGFIAGLTAALLAEFGLSNEMFASLVSFGVLVWAVFAAVAAPIRQALLRVGREMLAVIALVAVIVAPWLWHMALNAGEFPEFVNPPWLYSADLANFVVPTRLTAIGGLIGAPISSRFSGNLSEQGAYVGAPLLVMLAILAWRRGRNPMVAALLIATSGLALASLGASLHVAGWDSKIPLPWWIGLHLPLLNGILPGRFAIYVSLGMMVAAAIFLSAPASPRRRSLEFGLVAAGIIALLPDPALIRWDRAPLLPFFAPAQARTTLGPHSNVLILPYLVSPAMLWQWQSGMAFRQASGLLSFVPLTFGRSQFVRHLMGNDAGDHFTNDMSAFVARNDVSSVIVTPPTKAGLLQAMRGTGWIDDRVGNVDVFRVPARSALQYADLAGDVWWAFGAWSWMGRDAEVTTQHQPAVLQVNAALSALPNSQVAVIADGGSTTTYVVPAHGLTEIPLPPDGHFTIRPAQCFQPFRVWPNNTDRRFLSFTVRVLPR